MSEATKQRKPKAPSLLKSRKLKIAEYAADNPNMSQVEIAKEFSVTVAQVRRSIEDYESGKLDRKRYREPVAKIKKLIQEKSILILLTEKLHYAAAALYLATYLSADEQIAALRNLAATKSLIDKQTLEAHMKSRDSALVAFLYRKYYNANLTIDEIIALYNQDKSELELQEQQ